MQLHMGSPTTHSTLPAYEEPVFQCKHTEYE
jgi:hypothetical protein